MFVVFMNVFFRFFLSLGCSYIWLAGKIVSKMIYNVLSWMLNPTMSYHIS